MSRSDNLANELAKSLNSELKKKKSDIQTYIFSQEADTQTDVKNWISTGAAELDLAIANKKYGGIPVGRITEISGLEGSGKSLMAAHILANTQKQGGISVYIDIESALSRQFLQAIGVNLDELLYVPVEKLEDAFLYAEMLISKVRSSEKDVLVSIVIDSVAAATTEVEIESDYGKDGWATTKALVNSKAMRKLTNMISKQNVALVLVNQLRENLQASFGDKYTTSGGKAIGFHSSVRIRLKVIGKIKRGGSGKNKDDIIGVEVEAFVQKNRCGPPYRKARFSIFFDRGIDDSVGWLETLASLDIVDKAKNGRCSMIFPDKNGEEQELKFTSKEFGDILESNLELKEFCYDIIAKDKIMTYRNEGGLLEEDPEIEAIEEVPKKKKKKSAKETTDIDEVIKDGNETKDESEEK